MSFDTKEDNERFAARFDFPFPLLSDTTRSIGLAYGACTSERDEYAKRIAYVIGEDGVVVEAHAKVDPATYPREQLETL